MTSGPEQRRFRRVDVNLRTVYHDELDADESDSLMSNLSQGGCFIRTSRLLPAGSAIQLKFRLPEMEAVVQAEGRVRWLQEGDNEAERGMGVQFESITQADLLLLKQYIARKLESALW